MDDEVVKNNPAENADAVDSESTTDDNQETQAKQPDDGFMQAFDDEVSSNEETSDSDSEDSKAEEPNENANTDIPEDKAEQGSDDGQNAKGAERRKEQLNTEIRELVAQRNAIREETSRLIKERYGASNGQAKSEDELTNMINPETGDYYTRAEARAEITKNRLDQLEQERQREAYANQVAESRFMMDQEAARVIKDFPMFDPQSDQYDKELATGAAEIISGAIEIDPQTGLQIGSRIPIYQFYATMAKAVESAKKHGEISGREAAQKMMGAVDTVGSNRDKNGSDGELDEFERSLLDD